MLRTLRLMLVTLFPTFSSRLRRGPLRPSWSFMFEWMIRALRRDWDETASWSLEAQRAVTAARPYPNPHGKRITVREGVVAGVSVRRFLPAQAGVTKLVFFHGGSYVYGSTRTSHADFCSHLALATSLEVIGVEYRLAPEHPWPAQLDDGLAVCRELGGTPLILAGDSAGGHLAVKAALQIPAKGLVLVSPWADLEMPGRSYVDNDPFDFGTREVLLRQAQGVAGGRPLASLALANDPLDALPPTVVVAGGAEAGHDDILAFAQRLRVQGVDCTVHVADDMPHNPPFFEAYHASARRAFEAIVNFVRRHAGDPA
jgi:acetyl esterase/lipase